MMTQDNNGTTPPAETAPPAETKATTTSPEPEAKQPGVVSAEEKSSARTTTSEKPVPPMPKDAPPPGCEFIYSERDGIWKVRNVAASIEAAIERREHGEEQEETPAKSSAAGEAVAAEVKVPEILSDNLQRDEASAATVQEIGTILGEAGYQSGQAQRLIDLGAEFFTEVEGNHPHLDDKEAVEGMLKVRWGSEHDANLKAVHAASKKLGPKFIAWLETGPGNHLAVIETLAALGRGDFALGKEAAQREMRSSARPLR